MTEVDKRQELSLREVELIRELAQIRKEKSEELEFEKFDGYESAAWRSFPGQKACCQYQIRRNDIQYGLHPATRA